MIGKKIPDLIFIFAFMIMLIVPMALTNVKKEQVSEIDNRMLTELKPFEGIGWTSFNNSARNLESYFSDRVGFRAQMITMNQILNDRLFGLMVHPSYENGKEGHVFFKFNREWTDYGDFINSYTGYIDQMQTYCMSRGADFLFALNPSKTILYEEYLPDGIHFEFSLYKDMIHELSSRHIRYLDLAEPLLAAKDMGYPVCNVKFDAGHWNMHGAFFGMSAIMERFSEKAPMLSPLDPNDFDLTYETKRSLSVANFPISEDYAHYSAKNFESEIQNVFNEEIRKGSSYPNFAHYKNPKNPAAPRILVLHGSHISGEVQRYVVDQFSEAFFLYSYNVIDYLPYYFNIFQPDIVLYEVADRTIAPGLVDIASFENKVLQPEITVFNALPEVAQFSIEPVVMQGDVESERRLIEYRFNVSRSEVKFAYLKLGGSVLDFDILHIGENTALAIVIDKMLIETSEEAEIILVPDNLYSKQTVSCQVVSDPMGVFLFDCG